MHLCEVMTLSDTRVLPGELIEPPRETLPSGRASRWWLLGAFVTSLAAFIPDAFGRQVSDVKIDLVVDPVYFFSHLVNLWDPSGWFGSIRDQYLGYAFPTAPFFVLGHLMGMPPWLTERVWMALFVTVAFWGAVRLAEVLDIGSTPTRLAAGAAFALWPTFTILVGSSSTAVGPGVLLPWVMIPLIRGSRSGPTIRAAAVSSIAVLFMGGVNATVTLCALVMPALYLLTRESSPRKRSLTGWWIVCVGLACAWWIIPLFDLGAYGYNFLPYTEQALTINSTMSATSVLTGAGDWVAGSTSGQIPWDQAGFTVVHLPVIILGSALAAAAGLYGITRKDMPERRFLVLTIGIVSVATMAAYWGHFGGPFGDALRPIMDSLLAPLRNVYKLEPSIALVLVLGIAHALHRVPRGFTPFQWRWTAGPIVVLVLVALAVPYLMGRAAQTESYPAIPKYWSQVADYLARNAPTTTALVVPASAHGQYVWGWPLDQPLEALARSPWVDREVTPFGGPGSTRMVDAINLALKVGLPDPGLSPLLERSGIKYVVVQNDVEWQLSDSPSPLQVHHVLEDSGFVRVAKFGPTIETRTTLGPSVNIINRGVTVAYPSVEVFEAAAPQSRVQTPVATYPVSDTALVSGGPEGILQLLTAGVIRENQAAILAGDQQGSYKGPLFAVTDTLRRQDVSFGLMNDNTSFTFTATQQKPTQESVPVDLSVPRQMLSISGVNHQTVAVFTGAKSIIASSYGSYLFGFPEYNPANLFDGESSSGWVTGATDRGVGEWVQINFDHVLDPKGTRVQPLVVPGRPTVTAVRVTTTHGSVVTRLQHSSTKQLVRVPTGRTGFLRVTLTSVAGGQPLENPGLQSITIPGVHVRMYLKPPQEAVGNGARRLALSFQATQVDPTNIVRSPPEPVLARQFSTPRAMTLGVLGQAMPVKGVALDKMIGSSAMTISASSTFGDLPAVRPQNLIDNNPGTSWIAANRDPVITMQWPKPHFLSSLRVVFSNSDLAARPREIRISSPVGSRLLNLDVTKPSVLLHFVPILADRVTVSFPKVSSHWIADGLGTTIQAPVGLAELEFPSLFQYQVAPAVPSTPFSQPCGSGPTISIDGTTYQTRLRGDLGDLVSLQPLSLSICGWDDSIRLVAGSHDLITPTTSVPFNVSSLTMTEDDIHPPVGVTTARSTKVVNWDADSRSLVIGAGPASYLEVHQNYNPGWVATLDGKTLTPIRLDGWQQGYVVPAGQGGTVHLAFTPEGPFLVGVFLSGLGVLLLVLLALGVGSRRRGVKLPPAPPRRNRENAVPALVLAAAAIFIVGGPLVVAVPILAVAAVRRPALLPWIAAGSMTAAGIVGAVDPGTSAFAGIGNFSWAAQALAVVALAAVLVPLGRSYRRPKAHAVFRSDTSAEDGNGGPDGDGMLAALSVGSDG